ncbi:hypothetical protein AB0C96_00615 [Streptomyces sp. NPDC048506]|uniref:hypothetical protein n=1 Tax=Streptomyces sp. NPDC048506 TaxID=3155028 RepID=UPI003431A9DB
MRLRHTVAATVGALALALTLPAAVAEAATGSFTYVYRAPSGTQQMGELADPPSQVCLTLPEVDAPEAPPAHSPRNATDSAATVFTGPDCTGDSFTLRAVYGQASERLKLRSVIFH